MKLKNLFQQKKIFTKKLASIFLVMTMIITLIGSFPTVVSASGQSIGGYVFFDFNGNGKWEYNNPNEIPVSGVKVELYVYNGSSYAYNTYKTTNQDGSYYFDGLDWDNTYKVKVIAPTGKAFTKIGYGKGKGVHWRLSKVDAYGVKEGIDPTDMDINAGLIAGATTTPTTPTTPTTASDLMDISRTTNASNVKNGDTFNVDYTITPKPIPVSNQTSSKLQDIVLVMDTSLSMKWVPQANRDPYYNGEKSRLSIIKDVAKEFVSKFRGNSMVNISVVDYNKIADKDLGFTNMSYGESSVNAVIDSLTTDSNTNIGDGLRNAYYSLNNTNDHDKYIVLMTDGYANTYSVNSDYSYFMKSSSAPYYRCNGDTDPKGLEYAKKIASEKIAASDINTYIVGFGSEASANNAEIATAAKGSYLTAQDEDSATNIYNKIQKIIASTIVATAEFQETVSSNVLLVNSESLPYGISQSGNVIQGQIKDICYELSPDKKYYIAQTPVTFTLPYKANGTGDYVLGDNNSSFVNYSAAVQTTKKFFNKLILNGVVFPEVGIQVTDSTGNVGEKYSVPAGDMNRRADKFLNPLIYLLGDAYANISVKGNSLDFFRYQFINQNNAPQTMPSGGWSNMSLQGQSYNDDVETDKPGKLKWRGYDVNHIDTMSDEKSWNDPQKVFQYPSDVISYKPTTISTSTEQYGKWQNIPSYTVKNVNTGSTVDVNKKWDTNSAFMSYLNIGGDYKEASKFWGYIKVDQDGDYQFGAISDDGCRGYITVDGETTAFTNMFKVQGSTFGTTNQVYHLKANQYYPIHLEYFNWGGEAQFRMVYSKNGNVVSNSSNVPTSWFYPSKSNAPGEYAENVFEGNAGVKFPSTPGNYYIAFQTGKGTDVQREGFYGPFVIENRVTLSKGLVGGGNIVQVNDGFSLQYTVQPQDVSVRDGFKDANGVYKNAISLNNIVLRDEYPQGILIDTSKNPTVVINGQSSTPTITVNDQNSTVGGQNITIKSIEMKLDSPISYTLQTVNGQQVYTTSPINIQIPLKASNIKDYVLSDSGKSMITFIDLDGKMQKQAEFPQFNLKVLAKTAASLEFTRSLNKTEAFVKEPFTITYGIKPISIPVPVGINALPIQSISNVKFTEILPTGIEIQPSSLPAGITALGQAISGTISNITYTLNADKTAYEASPVYLTVTVSSTKLGTYTFGGNTAGKTTGSYTNVDGTDTPILFTGANSIQIKNRTIVVPTIDANENWTNASSVPVTITALGIDSVVKIQYSLDGINWTDYSEQFNITKEGQTTIYARTIDDVGNTSDISSKTVKIDRKPPTVNAEYADSTNKIINVTVNEPITKIWLECDIDGDGVITDDEKVEIPTNKIVTTATGVEVKGVVLPDNFYGREITVKATDLAGNMGSADLADKAVVVNASYTDSTYKTIDVTVPEKVSKIWIECDVNGDGKITDNEKVEIPSNQIVNTATGVEAKGVILPDSFYGKKITVKATDLAGNTGSADLADKAVLVKASYADSTYRTIDVTVPEKVSKIWIECDVNGDGTIGEDEKLEISSNQIVNTATGVEAKGVILPDSFYGKKITVKATDLLGNTGSADLADKVVVVNAVYTADSTYKSIDVTVPEKVSKIWIECDVNGDGTIKMEISSDKILPTATGVEAKGVILPDNFYGKQITVKAQDLAGNVGSVVLKDLVPPSITLTSSNINSTNQSAAVTATITDASGIASRKYALGNQSVDYFQLNGTALNETVLNQSTFNVSDNGVYTVYGKDNAGNEAVKTIDTRTSMVVKKGIFINGKLQDVPINIVRSFDLSIGIGIKTFFNDQDLLQLQINKGKDTVNIIENKFDFYEVTNEDEANFAIKKVASDVVAKSVVENSEGQEFTISMDTLEKGYKYYLLVFKMEADKNAEVQTITGNKVKINSQPIPGKDGRPFEFDFSIEDLPRLQ